MTIVIVIVIVLIQNYLRKVIYICSTEDNRLHRLNEFHQWILSFQSMVHYKSH